MKSFAAVALALVPKMLVAEGGQDRHEDRLKAGARRGRREDVPRASFRPARPPASEAPVRNDRALSDCTTRDG